MPRHDARPKRDIAAEVNAIIIDRLERGVPPWRRPWRTTGGGSPLRHQGTRYSGINRLILWALGDAQAYRSSYWMTYRQADELGGRSAAASRARRRSTLTR